MILEYGMRNFFGFKEGASVSFRQPKNVADESLASICGPVAPIICLKGANGAGKTHALKALSFLANFGIRSFFYETDALIPIDSYFNCDGPVELYVDFLADNVEYRYEVSLNHKMVLKEVFYKKNNKRVRILERDGLKIVYRLKEFSQIDNIKLRGNASIISIAHQYEIADIDVFYKFLNSIVSNVNYSGMRDGFVKVGAVSKYLYENKSDFEFVKKFISECDVGVMDVQIFDQKNEHGEIEYFPLFIHEADGRKESITQYTESSGTIALFKQLGFYKMVLDVGGLICMDEFDVHLHPDILPKILKFFLDSEKNVNKAQIIFTTHHNEIMDLAGRYRTYLVNKECNESYLYRLDEIPGDLLRNDRPISPVYRDGKIGGVPRL